MPGRPYISAVQIARNTRDEGMAEAIRQRLDGPPVHIEIGNEPFLSRVGNWAYGVIDWLCLIVIALAVGTFAVAIAVAAMTEFGL